MFNFFIIILLSGCIMLGNVLFNLIIFSLLSLYLWTRWIGAKERAVAMYPKVSRKILAQDLGSKGKIELYFIDHGLSYWVLYHTLNRLVDLNVIEIDSDDVKIIKDLPEKLN